MARPGKTITGTPGHDYAGPWHYPQDGGPRYRSKDLEGTNRDDTIRGLEGHDRIVGKRGDDTLYGGGGVDLILGNAGHDTLYGGNGDDHLLGDSGNDTLKGGNGDDDMWGGTGRDSLYGDARRHVGQRGPGLSLRRRRRR